MLNVAPSNGSSGVWDVSLVYRELLWGSTSLPDGGFRGLCQESSGNKTL